MAEIQLTKEVIAECVKSLDKVIFFMKDQGDFSILPADLRNFEILSEWVNWMLKR
jgi:hypothetical protein